MDISIVVPTYNRSLIVSRSLETLFSQDYPASQFEVIVVVDGSSDDTAEALNALRPDCQFRVIVQENRGLAGARNTGFRAAESDLVLFLDDDMRCDPGLVAAHARAHQTSGTVVVFGSLFLSPDSKANLASECFKIEIGAFHLRHSENPETQWQLSECVFSNSSIPREMLTQVGGFDEEFRKREDLELGWRLSNAGAHFRYAPDAIAYQYYEKTSDDLIRDAEGFARSDVLFARKHPDLRIRGHIGFEIEEPGWKAYLRSAVVSMPALEKCLLAPLCFLGEVFFKLPLLRYVGVRALQARRRVHWLRAVKKDVAR
jgi:GT2 family glycosyltransferase